MYDKHTLITTRTHTCACTQADIHTHMLMISATGLVLHELLCLCSSRQTSDTKGCTSAAADKQVTQRGAQQ